MSYSINLTITVQKLLPNKPVQKSGYVRVQFFLFILKKRTQIPDNVKEVESEINDISVLSELLHLPSSCGSSSLQSCHKFVGLGKFHMLMVSLHSG